MAKFSETDIGGLQTAVTPTAPVAPAREFSSEAFSSGVGSLSKLATGIFDSIGDNQADKALTGFVTSQAQLANAVDQGSMSSKEARMRARSNYVSFISANPKLHGDATKAHQGFINTSGLGKVIAEGTEQEKLLAAERSDAYESGFMAVSGSSEQNLEGLNKYREFKALKQRMELESSQIALRRARIGETSDRLTLDDSLDKKKAKSNLSEMSGIAMHLVRTNITDLSKGLDDKMITPEQGILQLTNTIAGIEAKAYQGGAAAGNDQISALLAPIKRLQGSFENYAKGTIKKEVLDNEIETLVNHQKLIMLADPSVQRLVATSELLSGSNLVLAEEVAATTLKMIGGNSSDEDKPSNPFPDNSDDGVAKEEYFDALGQGMRRLQTTKTNDPTVDAEKLQAEVTMQNRNIVKGTNRFAQSVDSPDEFNSLMKHYASDEFGTENLGGVVTMEDAADLEQTIEASYSNVVDPLITKEYLKASVGPVHPGLGTKAPQPATRAIIPLFTGTGVKFVPNPEAIKDVSRLGLHEKLKDLNTRVAPVLNTSIRAYAHIRGDKNYKAIWEERFAPVMLPQEKVEGEKEGEKAAVEPTPTTDATTDFIAEQEGFRSSAYRPVKGDRLTIGYGSTKGVKEGDIVTEEEAKVMLSEDVKEASDAVDSLVTVELTEGQKTALTSLVFNVGKANFKKSKALKDLNAGDLDTFREEVADPKKGFVKAQGKITSGLVKRRNREMDLFFSS
jgi:lysozyme